MNVKKGDNVMIITGKDKAKSGTIIKVDPEANKVVIEGLNMVSKCIKAKSAQEKGGIVKQNGSIDASNVMLICNACGKPSRISFAVVKDENGKDKKVRICKKCGAQIDASASKAKAKSSAKKAAAKKPATKKVAAADDSEAK